MQWPLQKYASTANARCSLVQSMIGTGCGGTKIEDLPSRTHPLPAPYLHPLPLGGFFKKVSFSAAACSRGVRVEHFSGRVGSDNFNFFGYPKFSGTQTLSGTLISSGTRMPSATRTSPGTRTSSDIWTPTEAGVKIWNNLHFNISKLRILKWRKMNYSIVSLSDLFFSFFINYLNNLI